MIPQPHPRLDMPSVHQASQAWKWRQLMEQSWMPRRPVTEVGVCPVSVVHGFSY
jgi:hypothetical protein